MTTRHNRALIHLVMGVVLLIVGYLMGEVRCQITCS